ncbi:MAG: septum formation initiator family protein [Treponema sp.]|jgi:cell division protein FtsB|nr:septum formation initiator family protein [Treponema sp.]
MRISKYLIALWTAVAVYTLFSFLGGPKGVFGYKYLQEEKAQQWANIKELGIINEELEKNRNNLLYDQDTLIVHARQMGYGHENERFVRIVGLGNSKTAPVITGNVYIAQKPEYISEKSIKIAAICAGLLVFAFLLMLEIIEKKTQN